MAKQWLSAPPSECEICYALILDKFYDARTPRGPWACMCPACFQRINGKTGIGSGQEYTLTDDKWIKTA